MSSFKPKQVPKSALGVFLFWGGSFWLLYADHVFDPVFLLSSLLILFLAGMVACEVAKNSRHQLKTALIGNTINGLSSSLGVVPVHQPPLALVDHFDWNDLKPFYPKGLEDKTQNAIRQFIEETKEQPHYLQLFESLVRLFLNPERVKYTAGYDFDATGTKELPNDRENNSHRLNISLLTHSLLVFTVAMLEKEQFCLNYVGVREKRMHNPAFKPAKNDPLFAILAFSHDIGKFMTFKLFLDQQGKVVTKRILRHHDIHGSRVISTIPEFWHPAISAEDREILQNILSCYHHPEVLPIQPHSLKKPEKNNSDRESALMEFLIFSDTTTGQIETGSSWDKAVKQKHLSAVETTNGEIDNFPALFIAFLAMNSDINLTNGKSLAFKTTMNGRSLLVFDEDLFIDHFCDYIKKPEYKDLRRKMGRKKDIHPMTSNLLTALDELGVVYRMETKTTSGRPAPWAIYRSSFTRKDEDQAFLTLNSTFIIDITEWEELARLKEKADFHARIDFLSCKFGIAGQRRDFTTSSVLEDITGQKAPDDYVGIGNLSEAAKKTSKKQKNPTENTIPNDVSSASKGIQVITGEKFGMKIRAAIHRGEIPIARETQTENGSTIHVVSQDQWLLKQGVTMEDLFNPAFQKKAGIVEFKLSSKVKGQHVISFTREFTT
jgi:hypothetical protein